MQKIKVIFFDIDGTLMDPATGRIPLSAVQTLRRLRENGIKCCVITGRPAANLPDFGPLRFDAVATFNGSLCCTETEVICSNPIAPADVRRILQNAAALGRPVSVAVRDRLAANGIDRDLSDYYRGAGLELTVAEDFEQTCREDVLQIMLGCREAEYDAVLCGTDNVKLAISWDRAVDVISGSGGKGSAVRSILAYFRCDPSEAIAFGDSHNDWEMLQAVGTGVAMGNAADQTKEIADAVCGSVAEDGICRFCLAHGLI